jgi:uroporphyrin-III C-methyltransferase
MRELPKGLPPGPEFPPGEVWLAGAGPGDPRLLTLLAVHALACADDIVHDALVDRRVLDLARPGAELHFAGKRGGRPSPLQRDINELLIARARLGRRVLRLKGGDPFVFGRGGEEALALVAAGIPYRVIPGVTSGLAAAALAGIPATTRETNHAVIIAAGHRKAEGSAAADWEALARTRQPIILYMPMAELSEIVAALQRGGLAPTTVAVIIHAATTENETVVETTLADIVAAAAERRLAAPSVVIIGAIGELRQALTRTMRPWQWSG